MSFSPEKLYFKALSLSLASIMSFSSVANATSFASTNSKVSSMSNIETGKIEKLKEWSKKHWILTGSLVNGAVGAGVLAVGIPSSIGLATIKSELNTRAVAHIQSKKLDTKPNKYTRKQEGIAWCWLACLQGIYKYNNVEVSQEDIFKKIFKVSPKYFEVQRLDIISAGGVMPKSFVSSVNSIKPELKYNKAIIHTHNDKKTGSVAIKNAILDYYNSVGKSAFAILDNFAGMLSGGSKYLGHVVNVVEINTDSNEIRIEDPATGLSRKENLDEFCENYYDSNMMNLMPMVEMFSVASSRLNLPVETHYFTNGSEYTKQSC